MGDLGSEPDRQSGGSTAPTHSRLTVRLNAHKPDHGRRRGVSLIQDKVRRGQFCPNEPKAH